MGASLLLSCLASFGFLFFPPHVLNGAAAKAADPISQALGLAALSLLSKQIVYRRGLYLKKELNVQSSFLALKRCRPAVASQRAGLCLARPRAGCDARLSRSAPGTEHRAENVLLCLLPSLHGSRGGFGMAPLSTGAWWGVQVWANLTSLWWCGWDELGNQVNGEGAFR